MRGRACTTHEDLCDYLQALAPGSRRAVLPFAGKNVVIYHLGGSDYAAAAEECGECEGGAVTSVRLHPKKVYYMRFWIIKLLLYLTRYSKWFVRRTQTQLRARAGV